MSQLPNYINSQNTSNGIFVVVEIGSSKNGYLS